jgi:hypothetical protein
VNKHRPQSEKLIADALAAADGQCSRCGQPIPKGTRCLWLKGEGIFHEDCAATATKLDTRHAHVVLMGGLEAIEQSLDTATLEHQVEVGSVLWDLDNRVHAVLEKIKTAIREKAIQRLGGQVGTTVIQGNDRGEAGVKILDADLRVLKHVDVGDLRRVLGPLFDTFFKEKVVLSPREDFEKLVLTLTDATQQKTLHDAIERVELTPRVSFRRQQPSKRDD